LFFTYALVAEIPGVAVDNDRHGLHIADWDLAMTPYQEGSGVGATTSGRRYWTLAADPGRYRVVDAVRNLDEDWWTTGGADLHAGDRVAIWKYKGSDDRRGIIAFGEVLTDPEMHDDDSVYWIDSDATAAALRVRVRYVVKPSEPLWLELAPAESVIRQLPVSRARGGTAHHVTADQWAKLMALVGGWPQPDAGPDGLVDARQPLVLIAPCYGSPGPRARFAATLAREIAFAEPPVRDYLIAEELEMLLKLHPGGTARFWGATSRYDSDIDDLAVGDPVLFVGDLRVQAIGKVGCKLRHRTLADALWPPEPGEDSWSNVYSVLDFRRVSDLLYRDIQLPLGYSPRYMFYRTQVTTSEQAAALIASLNLAPDEASDPSEEDRRADEALARALATDSAVVDAEASNADSTQYQREPGTVNVQRQESRFVARYRQTLPAAQAKRLRLAVGWTDLYLVDTADLIEAKRSAGHRYVREALGQLLDYAAHCTQPLNRLTALFPAKPTASDVRFLHAYGIDCVYWESGDHFPRLEAPVEARDRIRAAWARSS
jgi:hypothetical protein